MTYLALALLATIIILIAFIIIESHNQRKLLQKMQEHIKDEEEHRKKIEKNYSNLLKNYMDLLNKL